MTDEKPARIRALETAGRALYGERWQSELSRSLALSGSRRIRAWLSGERPVPDVFPELDALLVARVDEIECARAEVAKLFHDPTGAAGQKKRG